MPFQKVIYLGMEDGNDVVVTGRGVSKRHCRITLGADQRIVIEDLGSTNGTFVNGKPIEGPVAIGKHDKISLGPLCDLGWSQIESQLFDQTVDLSQLTCLAVGSAPSNDVVLDYPMVSRQHLKIYRSGSSVLVEDLGSTNGTSLNRRDNRISKTEVNLEDVLFLGTYRVAVKKLLDPALPLDGTNPEAVAFKGEPLIIGRSPQADVFIDHPAISLNHLKVEKREEGIAVTDLGSMNGTFVNGVRIKGTQIITASDELTLGVYQIKLDTAGIRKLDIRDRFTLTAMDISLTVPAPGGEKTLLDQLSFCIYPGEFCGLMGTSGAGKTTLLRTALGYYRPTKGRIIVNGRDLHQDYDLFRTSLGYVPQEDIMHGDLTVEQSLIYSAKLRLGHDLSAKEIDARIDQVLSDLGLFSANPQIRTTRISQISGGQRRRVNMAIELLVDPSIFFLDEPTSGLSSKDALEVMTMLRKLADQGKIILLTLHQPSLAGYKLMDNIIFLHKGGRMAYYGATYPDSLRYTNPHLNPEELTTPDLALSALETKPPEEWQRDFQVSQQYNKYVTQRLQTSYLQAQETATPTRGKGAFWRQWWILTARNIRIKLQDTMNSAILLIQAPIIALLIALTFGQKANVEFQPHDGSVALFLLVISSIWFGCSNAARDICGEWSIYQRERMYNLSLVAYTFSKISVNAVICAIQCAILVAVVVPACQLKAPFPALYGMVLVTALTGASLGLLVSAFASPFKKRTEIAIGTIPLLLIPMVVLGGVIKPLNKMSTVAELAASTMISRWSFEGMIQLEAAQHGALKIDMLSLFLDLNHTISTGQSLFILFGFFAYFLLMTMYLLKRQDII